MSDVADAIPSRADVIVVGGGNAAFCAAAAAAERGATVVVLEKAARDRAGGNSFYTAGAFRVVHGGLSGVLPMLDEQAMLDERGQTRVGRTTLEPYTREAFICDMERLTDGHCDATLTEILIDDSEAIVGWLRDRGLRWRLMYERQAYERNGRWQFWGGLALGSVGGGKGLVAQQAAAAERAGVKVVYDSPVTGFMRTADAITGVRCRTNGGQEATIASAAVVLAAGGFEASAELREKHLGEGWSRARVRGNPLNTGEVLMMALDAGAAPYGSWGSCHSVAWDSGAAPQGGDRELTNRHTRGGYPLGIVVNAKGDRFIDEGADYRNYTYAKYGAEILRQPAGVAYQVFDAKTRPLLRAEEYGGAQVTGASADTLDELAAELGIEARGLRETASAFNTAVRDEVPFDPSVKDGRGTAGLSPPKSNWAQPLDEPPYYGYEVTCGVTFTFGGLHIDADARVLDPHDAPIPGLYAAGEIVGGLFHGNYPGGTGLTSGAVFGRRAGSHAATQERARA